MKRRKKKKEARRTETTQNKHLLLNDDFKELPELLKILFVFENVEIVIYSEHDSCIQRLTRER